MELRKANSQRPPHKGKVDVGAVLRFRELLHSFVLERLRLTAHPIEQCRRVAVQFLSLLSGLPIAIGGVDAAHDLGIVLAFDMSSALPQMHVAEPSPDSVRLDL